MKIVTKDYLVPGGAQVRLSKWPTRVEPVYDTKKSYEKLLKKHVARLSDLQELYVEEPFDDQEVHERLHTLTQGIGSRPETGTWQLQTSGWQPWHSNTGTSTTSPSISWSTTGQPAFYTSASTIPKS